MKRRSTHIACVVFVAAVSLAAPAFAGSESDAQRPVLLQLAQATTAETDAPATSGSNTTGLPGTSSDAGAASGQGASDATAPAIMMPETAGSLPTPIAPAHDLSPWGMFLAADRVVKTVMGGLVLASLLSWVIWIAKSIELALTRRELRKANALLARSASLSDAARQIPPRMRRASRPISIALAELQSAPPQSSVASIKDRVALKMSDVVAAFSGELRHGTGLLATVGAMAPFVGLFGTVWGIMNSFIGISKTQTTNLAVVAPGIAEALLATAVGLFAAIPAVIFYNRLSRGVSSCRAAMATLAVDTQLLLSRDLDRAPQSTSAEVLGRVA